MGKGYYIFFGTNSSGVLQKIDMQIEELSAVCPVELISVEKKKRTFVKKVLSRIPFCPIGYDYDRVLSQIKDPEFIYVRRPVADSEYVNFFRQIKKKYPKCKIIIEIFTYPYDKDEFNRNPKHRIKRLPFSIKDKHYRKQLKKYVDRFVTYSKDPEIFGVKTIMTSNGVNVEKFRTRKPLESGGEINMVSVARMQVHHGYERIIDGLAEYYRNGGERNIIYHVVGDGDEQARYMRMTEEYGLSDRVIFYGRKNGEELDRIYDKADLAVASFGLYKYGIDCISTLKTCEYLAKGFPVISGCKVSLVGDSTPDFIYEFPNDETPVNIGKMVEFYDRVYTDSTQECIINKIRAFAEGNINMKVVMKPIVDFITSR